MDILDYFAYACIYFLLGAVAICAIVYRERILFFFLDVADGILRRYRIARHVWRAVKKAFRDDFTERKTERNSRRRDVEIMKIQRRQITDAARLRELRSQKIDEILAKK